MSDSSVPLPPSRSTAEVVAEDIALLNAIADGTNEHIRVANYIEIFINTTPEHFINWLRVTAGQIMSYAVDLVPSSSEGFFEEKVLTGQLSMRPTRRGVELLSDGVEAMTFDLLEIAPTRLKVGIFAPSRPHGRLVYALVIQQIQWTYLKVGDLLSRVLPPDWLERLWPRQAKDTQALYRLMVEGLKSGSTDSQTTNAKPPQTVAQETRGKRHKQPSEIRVMVAKVSILHDECGESWEDAAMRINTSARTMRDYRSDSALQPGEDDFKKAREELSKSIGMNRQR